MKKILVAYFSATGTTKKVAEEICKVENGDLYEIKPETAYTAQDLDYTVKDSRSNTEMADESCRPAIVDDLDSVAAYDIVFVGFPVWWGREPSIVDTFLEKYDFTGKTLIPFCTSGGSGVTKSAEHIRGIVGSDVNVDEGKRLGPDASEEEIRTWKDLLKEE
ncbi:MAG: NAD(P)H-dependent oxidoreductase [Erysipelotrichaceae bacterium]|nr:NAD(P)H-dependent oxidoreductase [Erysipelotrichaceae bacterium]